MGRGYALIVRTSEASESMESSESSEPSENSDSSEISESSGPCETSEIGETSEPCVTTIAVIVIVAMQDACCDKVAFGHVKRNSWCW